MTEVVTHEDRLARIARCMDGFTMRVSQAKGYPDRPGQWTAYVSPPQGGRRVPGRHAGLFEDLPREIGHHTHNTNQGYWWASVTADTEDDARRGGCAILGWAYGRVLAELLAPIPVPATTIPGVTDLTVGSA